ncbi:GNAT family N-acetyltransferase [Pseudooceanicola algae]|uniref:Uncharacterized protein n=1 Tax=Pseudooceanicola algae TaxID=1537215 RepID=A0A418SJ77_9RHOB|nr:GNAT family N-acetyltransferase [Pseudooceanicola algae]QPM90157.1 hypothetical protein PSAL_013920 [Pseudooceanicola algae]
MRDTYAVARVLWDYTKTEGWLPARRSPAQDLLLLARLIRRGAVRAIRDAEGICAFIAREDSRIQALYVHSRARRRGLGRQLLRDAKSASPELALWAYQASNAARGFYAAEGFAPAAWGDGRGNDEDLPEVLMLWRRPHAATYRPEDAA